MEFAREHWTAKRERLIAQDLLCREPECTPENFHEVNVCFVRTLSLGATEDERKLLDLYHLWCSYMQILRFYSYSRSEDGGRGPIVGPGFRSVRNMAHQISKYQKVTADGTATDLTRGLQRVQHAIDEGVLYALDAYLNYGIAANDLIAGRDTLGLRH